MNQFIIFNVQFGMNFLIVIFLAKWFVLPFLYSQPLKNALSLLLLISGLRHFRLTFTVPMLTNGLPAAFAFPAA